MGFLKETVCRAQDRAVAAVLRGLAGGYLRKFGIIENLIFDSSRKTMEAEILLHGETEPFTLRIDHFEIISEGQAHRIVAHRVSASREWIDALARDYLEGRTFRIPSHIAHALTFLA